MKNVKILMGLMALLWAACAFGQKNAVVYLELNDQINKQEIVRELKPLLDSSYAEVFCMISNTSNPEYFFDARDSTRMFRSIYRLNPSTPSPLKDVERLVKASNSMLQDSLELDVHFFFSVKNAFDREYHLKNIAESYLLVAGLMNHGKLTDKARAVVHLNRVSEEQPAQELREKIKANARFNYEVY